MWRSLKNFFYSLWTYSDLSPDLKMRRSVQRFLRRRSCLNSREWYERFWKPVDIPKPISDFVYTQMSQYSGLEFGQVLPTDRLNEDLHLTLICWFDWELAFCEDFLDNFGIDLSDRFDPEPLSTVQDLLLFLKYQLLSVNHP
ncbi:hypothetical protein KIK02_08370 [Leptodesmis sichuanensis A121]|jgi:hypothetical protein|nr:hypothetical protein KIK02_08370 [Leptodesmis sichuanensis A121]